MQHIDGLKAAALQIAAQLPDNFDEAMAVLGLAAMVVRFLVQSAPEEREQAQARLLDFPGPNGASRRRSEMAGGK